MFRRKSILIFILYLCSTLLIYSQKKFSSFRDSIDNALDLSTFLTQQHGVLPVLFPITEPAVGYGAIAGVLHFIPKKDKDQRPDLAVVAGGLTSNQTWLVGGGYK